MKGRRISRLMKNMMISPASTEARARRDIGHARAQVIASIASISPVGPIGDDATMLLMSDAHQSPRRREVNSAEK